MHSFRDPSLLELALTHRSWVEENGGTHNERLEWLGDSVLQLCVSELLYDTFEDKAEGELSILRKRLVNNQFLAGLARAKGFPDHVRLATDERKRGEQHGKRLLAGVYEAVLGAIYLDGGLQTAREWVNNDFSPHVQAVAALRSPKHVKQILQEWVHIQFSVHPEYRTVSGTGPDHGQPFQIEVLVNGEVAAVGQGPSKRTASAAAASAALQRYGVEGEE